MPLNPLIPALIGALGGGDASTAQPPEPAPLVRVLPAETLRGILTPPVTGAAQIDDKVLAVAPGLQIRNERNLIVMPGALQQPVAVRYQTDRTGALYRVWVLTAQEAAAP